MVINETKKGEQKGALLQVLFTVERRSKAARTTARTVAEGIEESICIVSDAFRWYKAVSMGMIRSLLPLHLLPVECEPSHLLLYQHFVIQNPLCPLN